MITAENELPIEEALAWYFECLDRGESVDENSLVARFPQHASELKAFLDDQHQLNAKVRRIVATSAPSNRLAVRCPNCFQTTDVAVDSTLTDLACSACGSRFSLVDQSETTAAAPPFLTMGRFALIERLGMGAFGSVWKARDRQLDRTVAIKIPRAGAMSPEGQEKFFREARVAAQLRHPNIVSVHEVGRDGDRVFIVSDIVHGVTLGDWLTAQKLTNREAAELCAKIADALDHAHRQGVVHRDLKPANIMIDGDGEPHLMDFGLARREAGEVTVTMDGQVLGTPAYMSPEQAQGDAHKADRRSDVYSLGAILFQLLTGELPFRGNARMIMHQVIHDDPPAPRKLNANIKRDLETITLKCLEKAPERRYRSAGELAEELRRFLRNEPIQARPIGGVERGWRWCRRHSQVAVLSALLALTLITATILSTWQALRATSEKRQKELALKQKEGALAQAEQNERIAEERLLDGLLATGDAALALDQAKARDSYHEARRLAVRLGVSDLAASSGLLASYGKQPPPLMGDDGAGAGVGGFDDMPRNWRWAAFFPDGRRAITAGADGRLTVWDAATGAAITRLSGSKMGCGGLAVSPDGRFILTGGCDKAVRLWDLSLGRPVRIFRGHAEQVRSVAFSPDGKKLASGSLDQTVRIWDAATGRELHRFKAPSFVSCVTFAPDGKHVLSGGEPDAIVLWDLESGQAVKTIVEGSGSAVTAVAIAPDGKTALSGSLGHQMILWDLETGRPLREFIGHTAAVNDVGFSSDGRQALSVSADRTVRLWDTATAEQAGVWTGHDSEVESTAFSPDGQVAIAVDVSGSVKLWDLQRDKDILPFRGHAERVISLATSVDGRMVLSGSFDKSIRLWDVSTGLPIRVVPVGESPVWGVALSREGGVAASAHEDGSLSLWNLQDGSRLRGWRGHADVATSVAFSPDSNSVLSSSSDGTVKLWDAATGELIRTFVGHTSKVRAVAFSPDGRTALSAGFDDRVLKLWDVASGQALQTLAGHGHWVHSLAFSTDGKLAASGGWDRCWGLWNVASGRNLFLSPPGADVLTGLAFSPDGKLVFTGSLDNRIGIWEVASRRHVRDLKWHNHGVTCLALCADGVTLLSGGRDGLIRRWQLDRSAKYAEFAVRLPKARDALLHNTDDAKALKEFARWYAFRGAYEWAAQFYEAAQAAGGEPSHLELARCYWRLSEHAKAAHEFQQAIQRRTAPTEYLSLCLSAVEAETSQAEIAAKHASGLGTVPVAAAATAWLSNKDQHDVLDRLDEMMIAPGRLGSATMFTLAPTGGGD